MKILYFLNILREGAGMINREACFAKQLSKKGCEVSILSYFKASLKVDEKLRVYTVFPTRYLNFLYNSIIGKILAFFKILFVLIKLKPDVIMVDLPAEAWWAYKFRAFLKYKVIFTYHGVANEQFYCGKDAKKLRAVRKFGHNMLIKADQVLVVSEFLKTEVNSIGVEAECLYNGYDDQTFTMKETKRDPNKILFVGRFTEYKGAFNIVKAFARTIQLRPSARLEMCGYLESETYLKKIRDYIQAHHLGNYISISGPISSEQFVTKLQGSGIFVNGSVDETFCMPLLEAQAVGTPCVAFAAGGIPEVVAHQKTGLLAQAGDVEDMAMKLCHLLRDKQLYKFCQQNISQHVSQFNYINLSNRLMQLLYRLKQV